MLTRQITFLIVFDFLETMKLFVWDFHGVLEEGNEYAVIEISNDILELFGYSVRLTQKDCNLLYGKKWFRYFEYLLPDEPAEIHLELQTACFKYHREHPEIVVKHIRPTKHAHFVLSTIKEAGHQQMLISNSTPESLGFFLDCVEMKEFFLEGHVIAIVSTTSNTKFSKLTALRNFLEGKSFDQSVIIGDSPSDIDLTRVSNGVTYLFSHPGKQFRECYADYKIHDLREILREV